MKYGFYFPNRSRAVVHPAPASRMFLPRSLDTGPSNHRAQSTEIVDRNITYTEANGQVEQLDVYVPVGTPPVGGWPVILAIHGGGWRKQNKDDYGPRIALAFVPHGYAVVRRIIPCPRRGTQSGR